MYACCGHANEPLCYRRQFGVDDLLAQSACPFKDFQHMFL